MKRLLPLVLLPFFFGCPKNECFVGDPDLPPEIELVYRSVDNVMQPLTEGGSVPLIFPPQGGKVMVVGVRAKNMDGCPMNLATSIRDVCSGAAAALEIRPVTLEPNGTGWLEPLFPQLLDNYSNLPACPRAGLSRDVHGEPYLLTVTATDKAGRMAEKAVEIIPTCAEPAFMEQCLCECRFDYGQGDACTGVRPDAGTSDCVR